MEGEGGRREDQGRKRRYISDDESSIDSQNKSLVHCIDMKLKVLGPLHTDCCIYRVPEKLRAKYEEMYTPRVVAIGPYHRNNSSLDAVEEHKLRYLEIFLKHNRKRHLMDYIVTLRGWEERCRRCYYEPINLSSDQFTEMMLVDGIFIIQLLLMFHNTNWRQKEDRILNKPWLLTDVRRDLTLLENQMPLFVIQGLFDMAFGSHQRHTPPLLQLAYSFFRVTSKWEDVPEPLLDSETTRHFLDALRLSNLPAKRKTLSEDGVDIVEIIPSATELVAAGIKLKRGDSKCLLDIKFENGVLEIPKLTLYHTTESFFRNMIAFEQCYYRDDSYMIDYMTFLDHLVDTPDDVKLLTRSGIIESWLGSDEAIAKQINSYCSDTSLWTRNAYFFSLRSDLVAYCDKPWNSWKASFKRDYLSSPWAAISFFAASVLLLLTVIQTVCSILGL